MNVCSGEASRKNLLHLLLYEYKYIYIYIHTLLFMLCGRESEDFRPKVAAQAPP